MSLSGRDLPEAGMGFEGEPSGAEGVFQTLQSLDKDLFRERRIGGVGGWRQLRGAARLRAPPADRDGFRAGTFHALEGVTRHRAAV
jgi:hypothetical protein